MSPLSLLAILRGKRSRERTNRLGANPAAWRQPIPAQLMPVEKKLVSLHSNAERETDREDVSGHTAVKTVSFGDRSSYSGKNLDFS